MPKAWIVSGWGDDIEEREYIRHTESMVFIPGWSLSNGKRGRERRVHIESSYGRWFFDRSEAIAARRNLLADRLRDANDAVAKSSEALANFNAKYPTRTGEEE